MVLKSQPTAQTVCVGGSTDKAVDGSSIGVGGVIGAVVAVGSEAVHVGDGAAMLPGVAVAEIAGGELVQEARKGRIRMMPIANGRRFEICMLSPCSVNNDVDQPEPTHPVIRS